MSLESQRSINDWADVVFGRARDPVQGIEAAVKRSVAEMQEFLELSQAPALHYKALQEEAADVVITLYRMFALMGKDLGAEVDRKMRVNRGRGWWRNGDGTGRHLAGDREC